jgi:hypothetical protein
MFQWNMLMRAGVCCCVAGVTTLQEAVAAPPGAAPDFIIDSVASLAGL